ncbi:MAG: polysaccharide deacetylase family protein [Winogradskyella sp.]
MNFIPVKTPEFVKSLFPSFVWNINTSQKEVYLTFDDGPTPKVTDWVIHQLHLYNAKATFFCIGNNIDLYPEIFQRVVSSGHSIGNHTYNHLKGWKTSSQEYTNNTKKTEALLKRQLESSESFNNNLSVQFKLFRPPYGKIKPSQSKAILKLGYNIILWDILSFDWDQSISPEKCATNIISNTNSGSIIVFHDSVKAFKNLEYALPKVLEYYSKKGFEFKAITKQSLE